MKAPLGYYVHMACAVAIKFSALIMSIFLLRKEYRLQRPHFKFKLETFWRGLFGVENQYQSYRFWCACFCLFAQTIQFVELVVFVYYQLDIELNYDIIFDGHMHPKAVTDDICWLKSCEKGGILLHSFSVIYNINYWVSFSLLINTILYRYQRMHFTFLQQSLWVHHLKFLIWTMTAFIGMNVCIVNMGNKTLDRTTLAIIELLNVCLQGLLSLMGVATDIGLNLRMISQALHFKRVVRNRNNQNLNTHRSTSAGPSRIPSLSVLRQEHPSEESTNSVNNSRSALKRLLLRRNMYRLYITLTTLDILVIAYYVGAMIWSQGYYNYALYIASSWLSFHIYMSFLLLDYFAKSVSEMRRRRHRIHAPGNIQDNGHPQLEEIIDILLDTDTFPTESQSTEGAQSTGNNLKESTSTIKKRIITS